MGKGRITRGSQSQALYSLANDQPIQRRKRSTTENRYALLSDIGDNEPAPKQKLIQSNAKDARVSKIPPITVKCSSVTLIHKTIIAAGVVRYNTKSTYHGTIVQLDEVDDFKKVVRVFKERNVNFHTYQLDEEKTTKIVLHGLIDLPISEVVELLKEEKIVPTDVKKMSVKQKKYDEHAVYLLHFPKGSVSMELLRSIRAINHCKVTWEYFSTKPGPMQCKRCQLFGHGAANCNRIKRCKLCAGEHESLTCPLTAGPSSGDGRVPEHKLKCANCDGNHTAGFIGCPKRPTRMEKTKSNSYTNKRFDFRNEDFPHMPKSTPLPGWRQYQPKDKTNSSSSNDTGLFDRNEILPIIGEVMSKLQKCKSKEEQLMTIFEVITKYCMPSK